LKSKSDNSSAIQEPTRPCLLCDGMPKEKPVRVGKKRWGKQCKRCQRIFPADGCESKQGAETTWHRLMHHQYRDKARLAGDQYGIPAGFDS